MQPGLLFLFHVRLFRFIKSVFNCPYILQENFVGIIIVLAVHYGKVSFTGNTGSLAVPARCTGSLRIMDRYA